LLFDGRTCDTVLVETTPPRGRSLPFRGTALVVWLAFAAACGPAPQTAAVPVRDNDPVVQRLGPLAGAYACVGDVLPGPAAPPLSFAAVENLWLDDDGRTVRLVYAEADAEGAAGARGWGTIWYDDEAQTVRTSWTDTTMPGRSLQGRGGFVEDGSLVFEAHGSGPAGGTLDLRLTYRFPVPETFEYELGTIAEDGAYAPLLQLTAVRTGPPATTWEPPAGL
jgi:hypothetical protein